MHTKELDEPGSRLRTFKAGEAGSEVGRAENWTPAFSGLTFSAVVRPLPLPAPSSGTWHTHYVTRRGPTRIATTVPRQPPPPPSNPFRRVPPPVPRAARVAAGLHSCFWLHSNCDAAMASDLSPELQDRLEELERELQVSFVTLPTCHASWTWLR